MRTQMSVGMMVGFCMFSMASPPHIFSAQEKGATKPPASVPVGKQESGTAIFYSDKLIGRPLASGEKYDKDALTGAHRTLPFGTMVEVTNLKNNKSVVVRINDRGPHGSKTEIIDLSGRAAQELDMIKDGRAKVNLKVVEAGKK